MQMVLNKFQKNMLIGMYHHNTIEKNKKIVTSSLYNHNGKCRVIFCTNALGMGINFPDIRYVVHYGPPQNVEDVLPSRNWTGWSWYWTAMDILLFWGKHLRKCDTAIKNYANGDNIECLRTHILSAFRQIKHDAVGNTVMEITHVINISQLIFTRIVQNQIQKPCGKNEK
jgi:hypothetical protein